MEAVYTSLRLLLVLVLLPVGLAAQPFNDNPCDALNLGATLVPLENLVNTNATVDPNEIAISTRFTTESHTVWFSFSAPLNGEIEISTCVEADFDTEIAVFTVGDCSDFGTYTEVAQNDDACTNNRSLVSLTGLDPGAEYYFAVDGYDTDEGTFWLEITTTFVPDNDLPCNATNISMISQQGLNEGFTNQGATFDPGEEDIYPGNLDGQSGSVWFRFIAPNSGEMTITNCDAATFDSEFTLFTAANCGDYTTYTQVAQNDDFCIGNQSGLELTGLSPGQPYYLAVDGFSLLSGNFGLNVSAPTPNNDLPCNAIALPVDGSTQTGFSNIDATVSVSEGEGEIYPDNIDGFSGTVWFSFAAPPSGALTISNCGMTTFDSELNVFSATDCGDYATYVFVGENDDVEGCPGNSSELELTGLTPGEIYLLAVDGYDDGAGDFDLVLTADPVSSISSFEAAGGSVVVYPNPSDGLIQLSVNQQSSAALEVVITDVTGRRLLQRRYDQAGSELKDEIDLRHLTPGVYTFSVFSGNKRQTERLVIQ